MNDDRTRWENMLNTIKQKGKRKKRIQKIRRGILNFSVVLILGTGFFYFWQRPISHPIALENQEEAVVYLMEESNYYDDELGEISFQD